MVVVGFNHNFRYKGEVFHVQTEDSGRRHPFIVTLLYRGGTILARKKTGYADIVRVDRLEQVVEELMKEQHREMLRRLKNGEFDAIIAERTGSAPAAPAEPPAAPPPPADQRHPPLAHPAPAAAPAAAPAKARPAPPPPRRERVVEASLDEIILSYLAGEDEED